MLEKAANFFKLAKMCTRPHDARVSLLHPRRGCPGSLLRRPAQGPAPAAPCAAICFALPRTLRARCYPPRRPRRCWCCKRSLRSLPQQAAPLAMRNWNPVVQRTAAPLLASLATAPACWCAGKEAGETYVKLSECHLKLDSKHEAASALVDAANAYKKTSKKGTRTPQPPPHVRADRPGRVWQTRPHA